MRLFFVNFRTRPVLRAAFVVALGGLVAGCSSGFSRFDTAVYDTAVPQNTTAQNAYPDDLDQTTTAGIGTSGANRTAGLGRRVVPASLVAPKVTPQGVYHPAEPTFAGAQPAYVQPKNQQPARQPLGTYQQAKAPVVDSKGWNNSKTIQRSSLNAPAAYAARPSSIDPVKTASVAKTAGIDRDNGWTSTGGTRITVRKGETLYNISKRYGVPVSALRQANGFTSGGNLQAGEQILVPNYVYSSSAPVSAPDNEPATRAARASTGVIAKAPVTKVQTSSSQKPKQAAAIEGSYVVKSGDSLSRISRQYGVSVAALQRENALKGTAIRIGQKLSIPGSAKPTKTASRKKPKIDTDPVVTASVSPQKSALSKPDDSPDIAEVKAPKRTGISDFRWPVRGRVVAGFGERQSNGPNEGIDISVPEGTAVRAAENGVVIYTGDEITMYGKLVLIRHEDGWVSAYAHTREFTVKKGDNVRRGQIVARSGKTGDTDRPKLHFELRKDSNPVDPEKYLAGA